MPCGLKIRMGCPRQLCALWRRSGYRAIRSRSICGCSNCWFCTSCKNEEDEMDKGCVDKHRSSMSGLKAEETEKWGRQTARERYGALRDPNMKAPEDCYPQKLGDPNNLQGNYYDNDVRNDWRRAANEDATTKPGFDHSRGKQ